MSADLSTITSELLTHSLRQPDKIAFRILDRHADAVDQVTYADLFERACDFGGQLVSLSRPVASFWHLTEWIFSSAFASRCLIV